MLMIRKTLRLAAISGLLITTIAALIIDSVPVSAVTTSLHITKYDAEGKTVIAEKTANYEWLRDNLPIYGDGKTHYYFQGPMFEGDPWDATETLNLKDKGAVKGTSVKDLCNMVGGMSAGDEVMLLAVDGYSLEFAYQNIYTPLDRQGPVTLCWYNGEDPVEGERYGTGYPGAGGYSTALQVVFQPKTRNPDGKFVFGNADMQVCLPEEKYQHFYEGKPSTNGLSGKWISRIYIYPAGKKPDITKTTEPVESNETTDTGLPWTSIALGGGGLVLIAAAVFVMRRGK
jgi:hypothetical protein